MNENDIIKSVACNLSEKRKAAALNNYEVLYDNINYVNDLLCSFLKFVTALQIDIEKKIKVTKNLNNEFKTVSDPLFYFRAIVPRIMLNILKF